MSKKNGIPLTVKDEKNYSKIRTKDKKIIREQLLKMDNHCAYCGIEFNSEILPTIDHLIPKVLGGKNNIENLILCCQPCNVKKDDKVIKNYKPPKKVKI